MSGRRTSGSSRPSLGVQVLVVFSFISQGKSQFKRCLGKCLEVPDILLPDIRGLLIFKFRRVTIRGAQPCARLSKEICFSEGSQGPSAGVSSRLLRGLRGALQGGPQVFARVVALFL